MLGTADLAATIARLRDDKALYFATREEILAAAQSALDRAKAAMPRFFSVLPKTDCVMREIPDYEAPYSTIAYYRQPHYDGTKPGEYFVNTYKPETRPRFELEALTWHESIPGHHLQIAIAQELGALPAFRKLDGSTAFVEGWALYTERLAEEMGLYSSDLDRLGKRQLRRVARVAARRRHRHPRDGLDARAGRGVHARAHRADRDQHLERGRPLHRLARPGARVQGRPARDLKLRAEAEAALGARFDLKAFHAVVLGAGAVTLPVLADRVKAWIQTVR